ncbi:MAG TPA: acyltransferase [Alphaproteobacteria bacterium]|nr:acyltransferase [Alphaproteobacteria bacterium]
MAEDLSLPPKTESGAPRLHALDALRGIAAFIVLTMHCYLVWPDPLHQGPPKWLHLTPLRVFLSGHASVILFFVLSGYVLAIPFLKGKKPPYISYVAKRFCRIYIPFAIAILLAALLYSFSMPAAETLGSYWFNHEWKNFPLTPSIIMRHLLMTGQSNDIWLDGVIWSLADELRISIIFPLLILLCRNLRIAIFAAIAIYGGTTVILILMGYDYSLIIAHNLDITFLLTLRFVPFFMLGILLVKFNKPIQAWFSRLNRTKRYSLLALALIAICMPTDIRADNSILGKIFTSLTLQHSMELIIDFVLAVAAGTIIVFARHEEKFTTFLNSRIAQWLGGISYSLYLTHLPILFFIFRGLLGKVPYGLICLIVIATSLASATVFYMVIERPSIALGKKISRWLEKKTA